MQVLSPQVRRESGHPAFPTADATYRNLTRSSDHEQSELIPCEQRFHEWDKAFRRPGDEAGVEERGGTIGGVGEALLDDSGGVQGDIPVGVLTGVAPRKSLRV